MDCVSDRDAPGPDGDAWFDAQPASEPISSPTRRLLAVVLGGFAVGAAIGIAAISIDRGAVPPFRPPIEDVALPDLTRAHTGVRVHGIAHYGGMVALRSKDGAHAVYLYPLMTGYTGNQAHVVVRTHDRPDPALQYEAVTVEGIARHPRFLFPWDAWEAMVGKGFRFDDDYVLLDAFD